MYDLGRHWRHWLKNSLDQGFKKSSIYAEIPGRGVTTQRREQKEVVVERVELM